MRASALTLPAFEVAVRRRRTALARRQDVRIHAQTHGAPGPAPFETGSLEDGAQPLLLSLALHLRRAGDDNRLHAFGDPASRDDLRGGPQVFDARVRAR